MDEVPDIIKFYLSQKDICLYICAYPHLKSRIHSYLYSEGIDSIVDEKDIPRLLFLAKYSRKSPLVVLAESPCLDIDNSYIVLDLRERSSDKSDIVWKEFFHVLFKGEMALFLEYAKSFLDNRDNCIALMLNILKFKEKSALEEEVKNSLILVSRKMKAAIEKEISKEDVEFYLMYLYAISRGNKDNIKSIKEDFSYVFPS